MEANETKGLVWVLASRSQPAKTHSRLRFISFYPRPSA
jgi:hypothetical protein